MERPQVRELEYVVALADELSFTRAAARLGIAQPPLSRAISGLERRIGYRLFHRTSRSVTVTARGVEFVERSRAILASVDGLISEATSFELVVAMRASVGSGLIAAIADSPTFRRSGARVRIRFTHTPAEDVRSGDADIALMCGTNDSSGLTVAEIDLRPTVALQRTSSVLTGMKSTTMRQLQMRPGFVADCPDAALDEILDRIVIEDISMLATADVIDRIGADVSAVLVVDAPKTALILAWHPHTRSRSLSSLVSTAHQLTEQYRARSHAS